MSTAQAIVEAGAQFIGVKRIGISLTTEELQTGTDTLRDMLNEWAADGIAIPFNIPFAATDEVNELDWTTSYMKSSIAIRMAPIFTVEPSMTLMRTQRDAKRAVFGRITTIAPVQFPDTLPIGEGNNWHGSTDRRYYVNIDKAAIATGADQTILDDEGDTLVRNDPYSDSIVKGQ